ncbi:ribonuclease H-like domain-containing protein, partial [Tanacetum coccineum]
MNQFCEMKGSKREFSVARTPQQNGVAKRKNRTLIEAARTMIADSKLPTTFWAEVVNIACKFDGKADEGFFIGYSTNSKSFRVFNSRTRIVEENLHVQFSENTPNIAGSGPNWLSDIDALIKSINYKPCVVGNQSNGSLGTKACDNTGEEEKKDVEDLGNEDSEVPSTEKLRVNQEKDASLNSTNTINIVSPTVNAVGIEDNAVDENIVYGCDDDPNMHDLEDIASSENEVVFGAEADMTNLDTHILVSP